MIDELPKLNKRRPKNRAYAPRINGFDWNVSTIAKAVGMHRNTIAHKLSKAGVAPSGRVYNSPLYRLSEALPAIYGAPQKESKP